jgi:hypothetical protein
MSTIKSSAEHLTLNADGASKDIKFQANGVEKGSLSSTGVMTATSFAGSGANLTGLPADSSKVDKANPTITNDLTIDDASNTPTINFRESDSNLKMRIGFGTNTTDVAEWNVTPAKDIKFVQNSATNLTIKSDGRGLSQFTAKAWANLNGNGTIALRDSHNISSVSDNGGAGDYTFTFANALANANYATTGSATLSYGSTPRYRIFSPYVQATSSVRIISGYTDTQGADHEQITLLVFGD